MLYSWINFGFSRTYFSCVSFPPAKPCSPQRGSGTVGCLFGSHQSFPLPPASLWGFLLTQEPISLHLPQLCGEWERWLLQQPDLHRAGSHCEGRGKAVLGIANGAQEIIHHPLSTESTVANVLTACLALPPLFASCLSIFMVRNKVIFKIHTQWFRSISLHSNTRLLSQEGHLERPQRHLGAFSLGSQSREQLWSHFLLAGFNICVLNSQPLCEFNIKHEYSI